MGIPNTQFHATRPENVELINKRGLLLPGEVRVETHRYDIPSISTANTPKYACAYHPRGVVVVVRVKKTAKYINRSLRNLRKGENLEQAVNRWLEEAYSEGAAGVYVGEGLQSTVGNQTIDPSVLENVDVIECAQS